MSSPDEVKAAAAEPNAIILDVRTAEEVKEDQLTSRPFHHLSCHMEDCSELMAKAEELMPDKNGAFIIKRYKKMKNAAYIPK